MMQPTFSKVAWHTVVSTPVLFPFVTHALDGVHEQLQKHTTAQSIKPARTFHETVTLSVFFARFPP